MDEIIEFIKDFAKYALIFVLIILLRIYVLTVAQVSGDSMKPNFSNNNILVVEQLSNRFFEYKRFDIVVFRQGSGYLVKRLIGLPGEKVKYQNNELYINDKKVENKFALDGTTEDMELTLEANHFYVLGDNRDDSKDSRLLGPIPKEKFIGRSVLRIWPLKEIKITN